MTAVKPLALAACLALSLIAPAHAASLAGRADVDAFIEQMVRNHGVNRDQLSATLLQADTKPSILAVFDKPSTARPWYRFRPSFVNDTLTQEGAAFWARHAALLYCDGARLFHDKSRINAINRRSQQK